MQINFAMETLDWITLCLFIAMTFSLGMMFAKRSGRLLTKP